MQKNKNYSDRWIIEKIILATDSNHVIIQIILVLIQKTKDFECIAFLEFVQNCISF